MNWTGNEYRFFDIPKQIRPHVSIEKLGHKYDSGCLCSNCCGFEHTIKNSVAVEKQFL